MDYQIKALEDARETISEFREEILEQLNDTGKASDDLLNDYGTGDSYHHESHVDRCYDLTDAAELIDQLYEHEETDSGLWEGQRPKEAIGTCAAYTYGSAVYSNWADLIKEINDEAEAIINDYDEKIDIAEASEEDEDMEYYGSSSNDLRDHKTEALGEVIDRLIG